MNDEIKTLLDKAASPHLVGSAKEANLLLARLQALKTDLRLDYDQAELEADLELNRILKTGISQERGKAEWKTGEKYLDWRTKKGGLSDVRAIYRSLERHCDMLINQERYSQKNGGYSRVIE